jgi:regulatory protein
MDYALTFLGVRSRSKKELSERLKRQEFSANAVNHTIERLVELGYINDTSFAREWFKNLKDKGNGPERVRAELRRKGISSDIIAALMSEYRESPEAELERLTAITERKMRSMKGVDPATAARRLTGYLARKGFSIDSIRRVLRALTRDAGEDNNFQD